MKYNIVFFGMKLLRILLIIAQGVYIIVCVYVGGWELWLWLSKWSNKGNGFKGVMDLTHMYM